MILKPGPNAPPHFFLIGVRAPPGGAGPDGQGEKVGVLVARSVIGFDGTPGDGGEIRTEDEPFDAPAQAPPRYEAEIAPWKPPPHVVVVDDLGPFLNAAQIGDADNLDQHVTNAVFGNVAVDRGAGFGAEMARHFGWLAKGKAPRLTLAGDAANFDPEAAALPDQFDNGFHNGNALPAAAPFAPGDRLRFPDALGRVTTVTIPAAPRLAVTREGAPLDPPLVLEP